MSADQKKYRVSFRIGELVRFVWELLSKGCGVTFLSRSTLFVVTVSFYLTFCRYHFVVLC